MTNETDICSFYAANGKHCVISNNCIICRQQAAIELRNGDEIQLVGLGHLDGKYRIIALFAGTLKLQFINSRGNL